MNPLETVSGWAVRHLKGPQVEALRARYLAARKRMEPLLRRLYGSFDAGDLRSHLEQRLRDDFDIVMVHSSVNHLLPMYTGTPIELVRMLVDWCGPRRTLAMPAFYFGAPGFQGAVDTFRARPRFDLLRTPSQMGLATELFRRWPGVRASRHPVYRIAALGPLAEELTRGHEHAAYPSGRSTPFEVMARRNALVIGIGKPFQVMTQAHHVEGLMQERFPVPTVVQAPVPMTLVEGATEIPFQLVPRSYAGRFDMWRLRRIMDRRSLREWRYHHVPLFAARAGEVTQRMVAAAERGFTLYVPR